jgi:hypothetical protein
MTKMPLGLKRLKLTQIQILKWIFEAKTHTSKIKRLRDNFWDLNSALTHEKTKMPLGAKLTQNDSKCNFFKMDFDIE